MRPVSTLTLNPTEKQSKALTIIAIVCAFVFIALTSSNLVNPKNSKSPRTERLIGGKMSDVKQDQTGSCGTNNLALNLPAHQSSTYANRPANWAASHANDGNPSTSWGICSCTFNNLHSWWAVDLGGSKAVCEVEITTILGASAGRLKNFVIFVSDTLPTATAMVPQTSVCAERVTPFSSAETARFACQGRGRYVGIQLRDQNFLHLCDVKVFGPGTSPDPCTTFRDRQCCETGTTCMWNDQIQTCRCATPPKDVVFILDGSGSITTQEFATQKTIVKEMIKGVVPQGSGIGIIQFSDQVRSEINLLPRQSLANVLSAVDAMTQLSGNTHIGDAVQAALGSSFLGGSGLNSESWIVLLTDGNTNGGVSPCTLTQNITSISGLRVLVIGVTSDFDKNGTDVNCLVSNEPTPANNIILMQSYSLAAFEQSVPDINRKICAYQ